MTRRRTAGRGCTRCRERVRMDGTGEEGCGDGRKQLPCCEACHAAKKKPLAYGKADQPMAQAAKRARKVEGRTESAAKVKPK